MVGLVGWVGAFASVFFFFSWDRQYLGIGLRASVGPFPFYQFITLLLQILLDDNTFSSALKYSEL